MSSAVKTAIKIRPCHVEIPDEALDDLRRRVAATRFADKGTVADSSEGAQLATIQEIARYWATEYDWRTCEAKLNAFPQFLAEIDGAGHPLHPRSIQARRCAAAHGHARLARLGDRTAEDHRSAHRSRCLRRERIGRVPSGDSVDARLRLFSNEVRAAT